LFFSNLTHKTEQVGGRLLQHQPTWTNQTIYPIRNREQSQQIWFWLCLFECSRSPPMLWKLGIFQSFPSGFTGSHWCFTTSKISSSARSWPFQRSLSFFASRKLFGALGCYAQPTSIAFSFFLILCFPYDLPIIHYYLYINFKFNFN
jgi:hypothetical protein